MMVKFATICDDFNCTKRSPEYTAWPHCKECMKDFCPDHGKIIDEEYNRGLCTACIEED